MPNTNLELADISTTTPSISPFGQTTVYRYSPSKALNIPTSRVFEGKPRPTAISQTYLKNGKRWGQRLWIGLNHFAKRSSDITLTMLILVLAIIPMCIIALAVKLDSPGPVIFRQTRVGKNGKNFTFLKFRSMYTDAEARLGDLMAFNETQGATFKMKDDPRITSVGRFIRRTSLDELPQLFNILFGQMSLVGPRPGLPREVKDYESWQYHRLNVTPGLTGLWQVSGRSHISFTDMIKLDIYYIENWSFLLDVKILFKTVMVVLRGDGAY